MRLWLIALPSLMPLNTPAVYLQITPQRRMWLSQTRLNSGCWSRVPNRQTPFAPARLISLWLTSLRRLYPSR